MWTVYRQCTPSVNNFCADPLSVRSQKYLAKAQRPLLYIEVSTPSGEDTKGIVLLWKITTDI